MSYGKFKSRWFDSIDPGYRPLTNELAAWAESALCTKDITSRKCDKYSLGDSFADCSKRSRSRMGQSRQGDGEDFAGHSLVTSFQGHLLLKVIYVIEEVGLSLERSEGRGCKVFRLGLQLDLVGEGCPVDPSYSLLCQIIGSLAVMGPELLTQLRHHFLFPVGKHTFQAFLVSSVHCRYGPERPYLALSLPLYPRSRWGRNFPWRLAPDSCWTSSSKSSLCPLLASLASSPSRRALSLHTSATSSFKPRTASWAISAFGFASARAISIWSSFCSRPGHASQELPSDQDVCYW
ncbi:hypothetical protein PanWU01x14_176170 [Parasponia andersonii]|uniref:Uncharacterized protein n=1 Tax=Parasponia andersonii TaxID=3476 RepID=A0A2P5C846_PARAD|nr:hypothetical protein PanWU01x14_176170 [Parasponia andersonii]